MVTLCRVLRLDRRLDVRVMWGAAHLGRRFREICPPRRGARIPTEGDGAATCFQVTEYSRKQLGRLSSNAMQSYDYNEIILKNRPGMSLAFTTHANESLSPVVQLLEVTQ